MTGHEGEAAARRQLEDVIAEEFAHLNDMELIRRIERAPDFGYDDESVELNRRLGAVGLAWMWDRETNKVRVYDPEAGDE
jgi:hypothetical protein